jgi:hypothetical protein
VVGDGGVVGRIVGEIWNEGGAAGGEDATGDAFAGLEAPGADEVVGGARGLEADEVAGVGVR